MKAALCLLSVIALLILTECKLSDEEIRHHVEEAPCPRDCVCDGTTATCRLINSDIQHFGNNIRTIVVQKLTNKYPIVLDNFIFKEAGLRSVNKIKIINSTISEIKPAAFGNLPYLSSVDLRSAGLKSIDPDLFTTNPKLKTINLCNNPIEHAHKYLLSSSTLEEIVICNANITHLNETSFINLPNAVYINLSNNRIKTIDVKAFAKLTNLEELNLSNNLITTIPRLLFISNIELSVLKLSNNPLTTAEGINSESLETLDLNYCKIQTVTEEMFVDVPNLIDLELSSNNLQKIHENAFRHLVELFDINLSHNNLTEIQADLFLNNVELNTINLSNNPGIKELPENGFISKNNFPTTHFDISNCGIEKISEYAFVTMPAISYLLLNGNKIKTIPDKLFYELRSLEDINLSDNQIETLDAHIFETNRDLHNINLSKNPLKTLIAKEFVNLQNLVTLDLSNCELSEFHWSVPEISLDRLTSMKILNISNNHFKTIRSEQLEMVPNLRELDLSNNPLECNEEFASLIHWLISHNVQIPHSDPTHLPNMQMLVESNGGNDQKLRWNQLARTVCNDKPLEQVTTTETTERQPNNNDEITYYNDDEYDYSQYDQSTVTINGNMLEMDLDEDTEDEEVQVTLLEYANYTNVMMFLIGAITSATVVFLIAYFIKVYRSRRPSNVFIATLAAARTRTDCGLVYKPLSEEKISPRSSSMLSRLYEPYLYPNENNTNNQTESVYQEMKSNSNNDSIA